LVFSACVTTIEQAIGSMPSVDNVSLSLIHNTLKFSYDPSLVSKSAIIDTIGDLGYDATEWEDGDVGDSNQIKNERTVTLEVEGMFCM
jgi:copper chaperone CopZ